MYKKIPHLWRASTKVVFFLQGRQFAQLLSMMVLTIALTGCGKRGDPKAVQCDVPDKSSCIYPPSNASA